MLKVIALLVIVLCLRWGWLRMDSRPGRWLTEFRDRWDKEHRGRDE